MYIMYFDHIYCLPPHWALLEISLDSFYVVLCFACEDILWLFYEYTVICPTIAYLCQIPFLPVCYSPCQGSATLWNPQWAAVLWFMGSCTYVNSLLIWMSLSLLGFFQCLRLPVSAVVMGREPRENCHLEIVRRGKQWLWNLPFSVIMCIPFFYS